VNWDVGVVTTPQGLGFFDAETVEVQTGRPIRSTWRSPGQPRPTRPADAIAVAPASFNTVSKWAAGISDNLALAVLVGGYEPHRPEAGGGTDRFRWDEALELLVPKVR
jgi:phosphopantothenoylcysteine synthetase/decarboxylase